MIPPRAIIIAATVVVVALIFAVFLPPALHSEPATFTVKDKAATVSDRQTQYLIYTDSTTYCIDDSFIWWRFDSSDWYGRVKVGATYKCTVQGWRVPFLSWYQNIVRMEEVKP